MSVALGERGAAHAASAGPVVIRLLGPVRVEVGGCERRPRRAATAELIAFLALRRTGATRDRLLEALWPDQDPRATRERLWQSASEARGLIGSGLRREGASYRFDPARVAVDVEALERAVSAEPEIASGVLERALGAGSGEPLEDVEGTWALAHIRRLCALVVEACERAGRAQLAGGEPARALVLAERGLALEHLNERLVRLAMEAEAGLGLRLAVERRYRFLRELLDGTLGIEPTRETRVLYRVLLAQD